MQKNDSRSAKNILSRLKKHLKVRTDKELSLILEVQPNTISSWKKRDTMDFPLIISICQLYKINLNEVFLAAGPVEKKESNKIPLITRETIHEYTNGEIEDITDLPLYCLPFTKKSDSRVFQVTSNNMFPVLEENTFAICEKTNVQTLEEDSIVAIVSRKKGFFISRIKKMRGALLLFNDNPEHIEQIELKLNDINELWTVIGSIHYNIGKSSVQKLEAVLAQSKLLS